MTAFRQSVEAMIPGCCAVMRALRARDAETADDLVQDTLVRALQRTGIVRRRRVKLALHHPHQPQQEQAAAPLARRRHRMPLLDNILGCQRNRSGRPRYRPRAGDVGGGAARCCCW